MPSGTIARLLIDKGFGFIRDESGIEHFFHRSSVRGAVFELLREGQRVEFTPEESGKGPRAGDVRLVEKPISRRPTRRDPGLPPVCFPPLFPTLHATRRRAAAAAPPNRSAFAALVVGVLVFLPFAGRFLRQADELQRADLIMVLGGARVERWLEAVD